MNKQFKLLIFFLFTSSIYAQDYFPLQVGNLWKFQGVLENNETKTSLEIIESQIILDSLEVFTFLTKEDGEPDDIQYYVDNINNPDQISIGFSIQSISNGERLPFFKHNYEDGETFDFIISEAVATRQENFITSFGKTYEDCWNILYEDEEQTYLTCKDIGLVNLIDDSTGDFLELTNFTNNGSSSVQNVTSQLDIQFLPNPATDFMQITTQGSETYELQILDLEGRKISTQEFSKTIDLDINHLANGTYLIMGISSDKSNYWIKPFVKQ